MITGYRGGEGKAEHLMIRKTLGSGGKFRGGL